MFLPLQTATSVEGVLHFARPAAGGVPSKREEHLMVSIANLIAVFLERQRLQEALTSAVALREADQLKSSLLSSVSHELKTPLAGLSATISNLLEGDTQLGRADGPRGAGGGGGQRDAAEQQHRRLARALPP